MMRRFECGRNRARWLIGVGVLLLVGVALAGCVDINVESDYSAGTAAEHAFQITIDKSAIAQFNQLGGASGQTNILTNQDQARQTAELKGYTYAPIDNDQQQGSRVSKSFDDPAHAGADLNALFNDNATDPTASPIAGFTGGLTKAGKTWNLDLTADSDKMFQSSPTDGTTQQLPPGTLNDIFTFVYTAKLPGKVTETNGSILPDGRVQWKLPLTGTTRLTASATAGGDSSSWSTILGIITGFVVVLVVAALIGWFFMRRKRANPPPADPAIATTTEAVPPLTPIAEARVIEPESPVEPDAEAHEREQRDPEAETQRLPGTER